MLDKYKVYLVAISSMFVTTREPRYQIHKVNIRRPQNEPGLESTKKVHG